MDAPTMESFCHGLREDQKSPRRAENLRNQSIHKALTQASGQAAGRRQAVVPDLGDHSEGKFGPLGSEDHPGNVIHVSRGELVHQAVGFDLKIVYSLHGILKKFFKRKARAGRTVLRGNRFRPADRSG